MASEIKTNKISPATGTALTLADSGDTLTLPSGTTLDIASGATLDVTGATVTGLTTGKVLQVLVGEDTTETTVATTTYTDVGLSQAITPSSTSSKILCLWNMQAHLHSTEGWGVKLLRDTTAVYTSAVAYGVYMPSSSGDRIRQSYIHLDSPSTTSAITYKVQVSSNGGATVEFNNAGIATQLLLMEIGA